MPTGPRSTGSPGSWPGSTGWAWRSPAASTPRRSWRWRSARSGAEQVVALLGVSPSLAADERAAAHDVARFVGVPVVEVETREGDRPEYRANGPDRCFHCKDELFATIGAEVLDRHGLDRIAYGENADDVRRPDRPGAQAATRHAVLRPLADAGLDKAAVRRIARALGLPCADKPAAPCLASRIPHHEPVTPAKLAQVEAAERALRALGFTDCRVRHHGDVARVELPAGEIARAAADAARRGAPRGRRRRVPVRGGRPRRDPVRRVHPSARDGRAWLSRLPGGGAGRVRDLDLDRARRRGYPEAVYCPGKTPEQVGLIAAALREHGAATLFTRATAAHAAAVLAELPDALHAADCGLLAWPPDPPDPVGGRVVVVAAGTADHPRRPRGPAHRPAPRPHRRPDHGRRGGRAAPGAGHGWT